MWIGDDLTQHLILLDSERGRQMERKSQGKRADKDTIRITKSTLIKFAIRLSA